MLRDPGPEIASPSVQVVRPGQERGDQSPRNGGGKGRHAPDLPPPLPATVKTDPRRRAAVRRSSLKGRMVSSVPLEALPSRRRTKDSLREVKKVSTAFIQAVDRESSSLLEAPIDHRTSPSMRLRRDESVIAEAAMIRRGQMFAAGRFTRRAWMRVKMFFREDIPSFFEGLIGLTRPVDGKRSISAVAARVADRVEQLTPRKKAALVTAPYALALALVAALLLSGGSSANTVTIAPAQDPALVAAAPVATPAPVTTPTPPPAVVEREPPPPPAEPERATELVRMVPIKSAIYAMPKKRGAKVAKIAAGSNVITFPTIEAPAGWIVAKHTNGAIGYVPAKHFDGERDPTIDGTKKLKKKKIKKAKRSRRSAEAPWPNS